MSLAASAPTHPTASPAHVAAPAPAARPASGRAKLAPFVIGAVLALALADTVVAPVIVAVLVGAVIFQIERL